MNVKLFMTVLLCLGCVLMVFMWHSANNVLKESQLYEKQFLFKISSLESENKMELKLIDALRVDIAKNEKDLKLKSSMLDTLHRKEQTLEDEKVKLQMTIDNIKKEYEKVNKDNNQWLDSWKIDSQNKSDSEKSHIKKLENNLDSLKLEYSNLNAVTTKKNESTLIKKSKSKKRKHKLSADVLTLEYDGNKISKEVVDMETKSHVNQTNEQTLNINPISTDYYYKEKINTEVNITQNITDIKRIDEVKSDVKNITHLYRKEGMKQQLPGTKNISIVKGKEDPQSNLNNMTYIERRDNNEIEDNDIADKLQIVNHANKNEKVRSDKEKDFKKDDIGIEKPDELNQSNKDANQLQARAPFFNKVVENSHTRRSRRQRKKGIKSVEKDFKEHKISDSEEDQLKKPNVTNDDNQNLNLDKKLNENGNNVDRYANPKIIKKEDDHQVKPPVPRKLLDKIKKNVNDQEIVDQVERSNSHVDIPPRDLNKPPNEVNKVFQDENKLPHNVNKSSHDVEANESLDIKNKNSNKENFEDPKEVKNRVLD